MSGFTVDVDQNTYLPDGGRTVNAVVTVTSGDTVAAPSGPAAEIVIVDCSGSMDVPRTKIASARAATAAAIDVLRDGTRWIYGDRGRVDPIRLSVFSDVGIDELVRHRGRRPRVPPEGARSERPGR